MGSCDIFALALKRRFNYSTWIIKPKGDSATFHVFCITSLKNKKVYIDVRGMTSNFCEFLTNTMFAEKDNYEVSPYDTARIEGLRDEWAEVGYQYANAIISDHLEYYKLIAIEDDNS